jgi:hypothetical protein
VDHVGVGIDSEPGTLRYLDPAVLRGERASVALCLEIEEASFDHRVGRSERGHHLCPASKTGPS